MTKKLAKNSIMLRVDLRRRLLLALDTDPITGNFRIRDLELCIFSEKSTSCHFQSD